MWQSVTKFPFLNEFTHSVNGHGHHYFGPLGRFLNPLLWAACIAMWLSVTTSEDSIFQNSEWHEFPLTSNC